MAVIIKRRGKDQKNARRLFGGGYRKPIKDEYGNRWCNCIIPNLTSNHGIGNGQAYCLRCHSNWYH